MRKIKITAMAALLAFGLAGCSKEGGVQTPDNPKFNGQGAYVSVRIATPTGTPTRAGSDESQLATTNENAIKKLFILTFNDETLVPVPIEGSNTGTKQFIELENPEDKDTGTDKILDLEAQLISGTATHLVAIANPGTELEKRIRQMGNGATYGDFNKAITGITVQEVTGLASAAADTGHNFTMISTPNPTDDKVTTGIGNDVDDILTALIAIDGKMKPVTTTISDAKTAAEGDPVGMLIERLSAKLKLTAMPDNSIARPTGSTFTFDKWTVDAVNTTFFPFAVKNLRNSHTGAVYNNNFYTTDPNYADVATTPPAHHTGLVYGGATRAADTWYKPVLPWTTAANTDGYYNWQVRDAAVYAVENTMAAAAQRYGNATRVVIRAKYYPAAAGKTSGDWFMYNTNENDPNLVFSNLTELRTAYLAKTNGTDFDSPNLRAACDAFFAQIKAYCDSADPAAPTLSGTETNFETLEEATLTAINEGGEVAKVPVGGVGIRWFKNGVNYYYYEIRHDNTVTADNAYSKYGVVRNNWYTMNLNKVNGHGTPWYPDLDDPGDGDPDPEDPIDSSKGYIGIDIVTGPWISWTTDFEI